MHADTRIVCCGTYSFFFLNTSPEEREREREGGGGGGERERVVENEMIT